MYGCMAGFQVARLGPRAGGPFEQDGVVAAIVPGLPEWGSRTPPSTARPRASQTRCRCSQGYLQARDRRSLVWARPMTTTRTPRCRRRLRAHAEAPAMALDLGAAAGGRSARRVERRAGGVGARAGRRAQLRACRRRGGRRDRRLARGATRTSHGSTGARPAASRWCARVTTRGSSSSGRCPRRGGGASPGVCCCVRCTRRAAGATVSTLQSSRLGYPVYRRLGYGELGRLGMWERGR